MSAPAGNAAVPAGRIAPWLALVLLVALAARLLALPASTERTMDPDSAHLMNVARCFERGQGFSNTAAWPAWMNPARLPMPETFKEPAYPFAMAALAPWLGGEFRAGVLISLLAGLVLPLVTVALARNLGFDRGVAVLAGLLVAANPLSIAMSVRVMVDALFPALLVTAFALAAWAPAGRARPAWADALTGLAVGLALMTRAQTLMAVPALALFVARGASPARAARSLAIVGAAAIATASPFLLRNLREFGVPIYSDVGAFGVLPYMDPITVFHDLSRPPAPLAFALAHVPEVVRHAVASAARFVAYTVPDQLAGHPVWVAPLAAGLVLAFARWRTMLPIALYLLPTLGLVFVVVWDARYFSSTVPLWSLVTALGGMWLYRALAPVTLAGPLRGKHLLLAAMVVSFAVQAVGVRRDLARSGGAETDAAMALGPVLRGRLRPDEAVMAVMTSTYSWFADRPSVSLVVADEARFMETVRRLKVRYAALPTSRLGELASRYPGGRLPSALVVERVLAAADVTLFGIRDPAAEDVSGRRERR